jgi:hypothetical protein
MFGVCSFCGEGPVVAWFEAPDFKVSVSAPEQVRAEGAWLACAPCALLVDVGDRDGLARRGTNRLQPGLDSDRALAHVRRVQDRFWAVRSSI